MLTPALWVEELRAGRLVQPFALVGDEDRFYWLVYPEGRRRVPKIQAFREWLLAEVARFEAAAQVSAAPALESRSSPPR